MFRLCLYLFYLYTSTILSPNGGTREDLKVSFFSPDAPQEFIAKKVIRMAFLSNESVDLIKNTDRKDRSVKRHINDVKQNRKLEDLS